MVSTRAVSNTGYGHSLGFMAVTQPATDTGQAMVDAPNVLTLDIPGIHSNPGGIVDNQQSLYNLIFGPAEPGAVTTPGVPAKTVNYMPWLVVAGAAVLLVVVSKR